LERQGNSCVVGRVCSLAGWRSRASWPCRHQRLEQAVVAFAFMLWGCACVEGWVRRLRAAVDVLVCPSCVPRGVGRRPPRQLGWWAHCLGRMPAVCPAALCRWEGPLQQVVASTVVYSFAGCDPWAAAQCVLPEEHTRNSRCDMSCVVCCKESIVCWVCMAECCCPPVGRSTSGLLLQQLGPFASQQRSAYL